MSIMPSTNEDCGATDTNPVEELWRPIPGFSSYVISNRGRVVSHRMKKPRELKLGINHNGYYHSNLVNDEGRLRPVRIHRLMALTWHGDPFPGAVVRHLNGDRLDNRAENLAWGTMRENNIDSVLHGTHDRARRTHCRRGHEYTPENTWAGPVGALGKPTRVCATCTYAKKVARRKRFGYRA